MLYIVISVYAEKGQNPADWVVMYNGLLGTFCSPNASACIVLAGLSLLAQALVPLCILVPLLLFKGRNSLFCKL